MAWYNPASWFQPAKTKKTTVPAQSKNLVNFVNAKITNQPTSIKALTTPSTSASKGVIQYSSPAGPAVPTPLAPTVNTGPSIDEMLAGYAADRKAKDLEFTKLLDTILGQSGVASPYVAGTFNADQAKSDAATQFNPYYDTKVNQQNQDWDLTKKEIGRTRESSGLTYMANKENMVNNQGAAGTLRSGVGMRQRGLAEINNVNAIEGINNAETQGSLANDRTLTDINNNRKTDITKDVEYRRGLFTEQELNRYKQYQDARSQAFSRALTQVYGA